MVSFRLIDEGSWLEFTGPLRARYVKVSRRGKDFARCQQCELALEGR